MQPPGADATARPLNGGLLDPQLPAGRAGAEVRVDTVEPAIVATADERAGLSAPCERRLPVSGLRVELGGASGLMLFARHPDWPEVTVYTEDRAVIADLQAAAAWGDQAEVFARLDRARRRGRWAVPAWLLAIGLCVALLLQSLDALVDLIPMQVDQQLGAFAEPQLLAQAGGPQLHDATVTKAVRAILDRVVAAGPRPDLAVKLTVIDAPAVNAFALPGGYLVVYTGLLRDAADPAEVASVLAHELGHVTRRHGLHRLARSAGIVLVVDTLLGDVAGLLGAAREFFTLAAVNNYSRAQEEEADAEAVRTLHAAGIDPRAGRAFFSRLAKQTKNPLDDRALAWISTHPSHQARVEAIDQQLAALGATKVRPLEVDWAAVRLRLGKP